MTTFDYASSKLGKIKPETKAVAREVFDAAQSAGHDIWFMWGMGDSSEHATGLALDLMVHNHADGQWVRDYVWANRARLHLRHAIWEQHITSTVVSPGVVRQMEDRGSPTENHMDHVHVLLFPGEYQTPVDSATPVSTPAPDPIPASNVPNHLSDPLAVDGKLGKLTIARWQEIMGTPVDGEIDTDRPSVLVSTVQRRLKATVNWRLDVDGYGIAQDNHHYETVGALQQYLKSPVDCVMSSPVSTVVKALQRRLNEGWF